MRHLPRAPLCGERAQTRRETAHDGTTRHTRTARGPACNAAKGWAARVSLGATCLFGEPRADLTGAREP